MIDLHCHILPGLDDGPATWDQALAMARLAEADGVQVIVATPHCHLEGVCPAPDHIRDTTRRLNELLQTAGLQLRAIPGSEVRAAAGLVEALQAGEVLTMGDRGHRVLVELPPVSYPNFAGEMFFRLQLAGYTPVIAHAERYAHFCTQPEALADLLNRGCEAQINVGSLTGREGRRVQNWARELVQCGLVAAVASDGHNTTNRPPLLTPARRALRLDEEEFQRLVLDGPLDLLEAPHG